MKCHLVAAAVGAVVISVPTSSQASDEVFDGVSILSEYVSRAWELSDGPFAGTYIDAGRSGFYLAAYHQTANEFAATQSVWRGNASFAPGRNDVAPLAGDENVALDFAQFETSDRDFWSIVADVPFSGNWRAEMRHSSSDAEDGGDTSLR